MQNAIKSGSWADRRSMSVPSMIALTTFGILALELALIRWTAGQIRVFAYFNNVVLIAAFLGMGLGVALGKRWPGLVHATLPVLLALAVPLGFSEELGLVRLPFPDQAITLWGADTGVAHFGQFASNMAVFLALLAAVIAVFVCAGAPLGYLFGRAEVLRAYSADLLGGLVGILAFTLLAWVEAGPAWWLALGVVPFAWLSLRWWSAVLAVAIVGLGQFSTHDALFSPYNRIVLRQTSPLFMELEVNRDFHQYIHNLSEQRIADPKLTAGEKAVLEGLRDFYELPFAINAQRKSAVVVGAGTGNDVQAALRRGYGEVNSVDIDARIIALGRQHNQEQPYSNPRAIPVVDDARSFFQKSQGRRFDVVCFGLLDSHAMMSSMSTLRLDNYVYTEEGIRAAWRCVAPDGHLSIAMASLAGSWFFERLYWTITKATGREPIAIVSPLHGQTLTFIVPGPEAKLDQRAFQGRRIVKPVKGLEQTVTTSDDWPFLYLRFDVIPWGYAVVLGFLLLVTVLSIRPAFGGGLTSREFHWPLFLMGAAFLLVETRGVTSLSLLFGSTWVVNSVVFGGILTMVLLANLAVARWRWTNPVPWFAALFGALALLTFFPLDWLQTLPLVGRAIAGGFLTGLPIGIAGVIVPMLLARATNPGAALGANLVGAVLGGCLEYYSMLGGLRSTVLMALGLYLVALLLLWKATRRTGEGAPRKSETKLASVTA